MAEALFQVLLDNLSSLIKKEIGLILGVDKEMKKLSSTLTTIQAVLEDAEDKQFESKQIQDWLRKLNHLAYEIDDVLDEAAIELSNFEKKNNKFNLKKVLFRHKIGRRLKEMAEKLDDVAMERKKFHLRESSIERQNEVIPGRAKRETGSFLSEPNNVFGRDEEKEKIVDILVNHVKDRQLLTVLPIIGLGGLGKTTLAQLVYKDKQIAEHFDLKLWVCVSDDFNLKTLIKAMLESAKGSASDSMSLDALQHRLWEFLNNKRYLLILDDVWSEDQEEWAMLKNILACGSTGASIIVTTRLKNVAGIMGTLPAHCLSVLSEEHCWLLLNQCAFGEQVEAEIHNLEVIGKEIVKKCGGVPLAAKTLGGILRFKREEKDWIYIKESELWNLEQKKHSILPSLRLSYRHLPLVLRRCFAYCALFPKDSIINKEKLIRIWIAHGCISSNGRKEVEDIGDEIWNELILRSLLSNEWETTCKMHDLVHDLALSIMENQVPGAHAINGPNASNSKIRQLHVSEHLETFPTSIQLQVPTLTTLVNFCRLRMLTIFGRNIAALPSSIGKLKQLRHLKLSNCSIRTLPNTICGLQNLQILDLDWCTDLLSLPKNMRYMVSLRHLCLEGGHSLIETPSRIGELSSLKTLSVFIVGDKKGNQLGELECLNLGGSLEIQHLERVKNQKDAEKANLREKSNLHTLLLRWEDERDASESREMTDKMVLEALEPHPNIQTLRIFGFKGRVFPVWIGNPMMAKLIEIIIDDCPNCLHLPLLGDLPRLKKLRLERLGIEFIAEDDVQGGDAFPSLEELELWSLPNLKGLLKEEVKEMFPNLQMLRIKECPSLRLPRLPSLKKLDVHEKLTLSSFSKPDNLTSLELIRDESCMTCTPNEALESLSNLKELTIWCGHEHTLPEGLLQHLTALEGLCIYFSEDLVELPDEIKYLCSLKTLMLSRLPKMVCLPKGIQHLHSLQVLSLERLDELTSLPDWLDKLISLEVLSIRDCPRIASLPSSIRGMTNLRTLEIVFCPELKRRFEEGKGEDWQNIAHIPNLEII